MAEEKKRLKIMICQGPGDEKDSAEIWYGDDVVAEVWEENGKNVVVLRQPKEKFWKFDYEEFLNLLKDCQQIAQRPVN